MVVGTDTYKISAEVDLDGRYLADQYFSAVNTEELLTSFKDVEAFESFMRDYSEKLVDQVGDEIDRIEQEIRQAVPKATDIDLEPN